MICVHTYITIRCDQCGATFGDEYQYGDVAREHTRARMDARRAGWQHGKGDTCPACVTVLERIGYTADEVAE